MVSRWLYRDLILGSKQIQQETGASVTTKGVWYPDKSKATDKDPPLYLHISASTQAMVDAAVTQINDRIATDLGSLVEDRRRDDKPRERVSIPPRLLPATATHNNAYYFSAKMA